MKGRERYYCGKGEKSKERERQRERVYKEERQLIVLKEEKVTNTQRLRDKYIENG